MDKIRPTGHWYSEPNFVTMTKEGPLLLVFTPSFQLIPRNNSSIFEYLCISEIVFLWSFVLVTSCFAMKCWHQRNANESCIKISNTSSFGNSIPHCNPVFPATQFFSAIIKHLFFLQHHPPPLKRLLVWSSLLKFETTHFRLSFDSRFLSKKILEASVTAVLAVVVVVAVVVVDDADVVVPQIFKVFCSVLISSNLKLRFYGPF